MTSNPYRHRGVAVFAVMVMFMLIAAAVVAMSLVFTQQARRTRAAVTGSQIRQLLLAAAPAARQELLAHGSGTRRVTTPVEGATLSLDISPDRDGRIRILVRAAYRADKGTQTLIFAPQGSTDWRVVEATLGSVGN